MKGYSSALTTLDLNDAATIHPVLGRYYAGAFPVDALSTLIVSGRPKHLIYNVSPSYTQGSHWISVFLNKDLSAVVVDSLGMKPSCPVVLSFLRRHAEKIIYSSKLIQNPSSAACGLYCLSHGLASARGYRLDHWLSQFGPCLEANDRLMQCEFMQELAIPSLFTPRLRNWEQIVARACKPRRCESSQALVVEK